MQPAVAVFFAIRDGLNNARRGNVPYFWAIFTEPSRRMELIPDGRKAGLADAWSQEQTVQVAV